MHRAGCEAAHGHTSPGARDSCVQDMDGRNESGHDAWERSDVRDSRFRARDLMCRACGSVCRVRDPGAGDVSHSSRLIPVNPVKLSSVPVGRADRVGNGRTAVVVAGLLISRAPPYVPRARPCGRARPGRGRRIPLIPLDPGESRKAIVRPSGTGRPCRRRKDGGCGRGTLDVALATPRAREPPPPPVPLPRRRRGNADDTSFFSLSSLGRRGSG